MGIEWFKNAIIHKASTASAMSKKMVDFKSETNYPVTVKVEPETATLYCFKAVGAGPAVTAPDVLNTEPWALQTNLVPCAS